MQATREASAETLLELATKRLNQMANFCSTTLEIKTGYGLNVATEEACLRIINNLNSLEQSSFNQQNNIRVIPTFLGAHSIPPEYKNSRDNYVDLIVEETLPSFVGLARFCDVFCEREAFTLEESRRILTRARELGYRLKLHPDQLSPPARPSLPAKLP